MVKKKVSTKKRQRWHQKRFSKKSSFAILFICILFYIAILLFYSLFSFYKAGYDGRALGLTISYDLLGIFNGNFFASPAPTLATVNVPTQIPSAMPTHGMILETFTYYIQVGNSNDKTDKNGNPIIHAILDNGAKIVVLNPSLDGRTAEIPVNTLIYLHFAQGQYDVTVTPNKGVVETPEKYGIPPSIPSGYIGLLHVLGQGSATIKVIETADHQLIPTSTFVATTNTNCNSVEYTPPQAASFKIAYENKGNANLHLIVVCGTPSQGSTATQYSLTTNNGVISDSQFSYADASPPGPSTENTCSLSVTDIHLAVVTCGESSFNLSY